MSGAGEDEVAALREQIADLEAVILSVVSLCATGGQIVHKNFSLTV